MDRSERFIKSSAIYFVGSVLTKLISFFLLPLYTAWISTAEMGYYNTSVNYLGILIPVVCMEIWSAIMRYMFDYGEQDGRYTAINNGLTIFMGSLGAYTLLFIGLSAFTSLQYLWLIYFYGLFTMLHNVYTYCARGLGYNATFAVSGIIGSLVNCLSNIFMILVLHMTVSSLYIAMIIGLFVQIAIMEHKVGILRRLGGFRPDGKIIKSMISFALPLALNSACFWFLSGYNTIGITHTLGLESSGLYGVAARFTTALSLVSTCFTLAWQELVFSMGNDREDKSAFYSKASNYYLKFLFAGLLALVPFVRLVFPFMVDSSYDGAFILVPLYLFATVASIYSNFLGNIFSAEKNTRVVFYSTVVAAAVNVSLFHLLVPTLGIQAANIALLSGFAVNIVMRLFILRKNVAIRLDYAMIAGGTVLFAATLYVYTRLGTAANAVCLVIVCLIALYALRDIIKKVFEAVRHRRGCDGKDDTK